MFSRFYYDFVFVFFHVLMLFFCFLGVFDSIFVNLIQVEATCIRKNTKQYPKWKYCMAFSWLPMMLKIERVKSWTSTGFKGQEKNEKNEKVKLAWSQGFGRVRESGFKLDVICSSRRQFWKVM